MIILRRYHEHPTMQHYMAQFTKVAMKFLTNFERQKKGLLKSHKREGDKLKHGRGSSVKQISNPEDQKMKWIQKTLYIHLLKNIIENIGSIHLNAMLKTEILKTYLNIQKRYKTPNSQFKEYLMLISLFGDPETIIAEYKASTKNKSLEREDEVDLVSIKSHKIQNNIHKSVRKRKDSTGRSNLNHINLTMNHKTSKLSPHKQKSMRVLKKDDNSELNFSVMSELPVDRMLKENHEKLLYQPDSITMGKYKLRNKLTKNDERVLREIEKVRMRRQRRLEDKLFEEERKQMHQEKLKNQIMKELERRKVEHGIMPYSKKRFKKKNLIRDTSIEEDALIRKTPQIEIYDFSLEEEKDKNDVHNFLRTYNKLLQHLFKTYANSGYSQKI